MSSPIFNHVYSTILITVVTTLIKSGESFTPSYSHLVANIETALANLEETINDLRLFESTPDALLQVIGTQLPVIAQLIKNYRKDLQADAHVIHVLKKFDQFSDPLRLLWGKVKEMGDISFKFFHNMSTALTELTHSYSEKLKEETDPTSSPLVAEYTQNLKSLLSHLIEFQFPSVYFAQKQSLQNYQKTCQLLAVEVAETETSKQVSQRVKRAINQNPQSVQCTSSNDTTVILSPRSKILHWTEETKLKILPTLTYAIFTCFELHAVEAIITYLLSLYQNDGQDLQELQQRETDLALTAVYIREKFSNVTITHKKSGTDFHVLTTTKNGREVELREIWMCDPPVFYMGTNVIRFSGVFQPCIAQEHELSWQGSCSGKCEYYSNNGKHMQNDYVSSHLACGNPDCKTKNLKRAYTPTTSKNCKRLEGEIQICRSMENDKRYNWFSTSNETYGDDHSAGNCSAAVEIVKEDWYLEHGILSRIPQLCEICLCECNHAEIGMRTIAYFNIAEVVSNLEENKVITGIRFETKYGIIFPAIETGHFLENGQIDETTLQWHHAELLSKETTFDSESILRLGINFDTIYLDEIGSSHYSLATAVESVITGVRFRHHKSHILLEAKLTSVDPIRKTLISDSSVWINRLDDHAKRKILKFPNDSDPLRATSKTFENSIVENTKALAVQFMPASLKKTAGQVVVPYFDSQPVFQSPRTPIYGIGLYLKSVDGFAGFVGFKISVH